MSHHRSYSIRPVKINGIKITKVIIDSHYEKKHSVSVNDSLILTLVQKLDGRFELPTDKDGPYSYFATLLEHESKQYRLVWLLEDNEIYIGIVNTYRDNRRT